MVYPVCSVLLQNCLKDFTHLTFWKLPVAFPQSYRGSNGVLLPTLGSMVDYTNYGVSMGRLNSYHASFNSFPGLQHYGALQISVDIKQASGFGNHFQLKLCQDSAETQTLNGDIQRDSCDSSSGSPSDHNLRRKKRKRKHGNKGRVPWNKGRKHSAETRALIKKRTMEALRDPQVRMKMAEHPRRHSIEVKQKIGSSLRQLWDKRLKWKILSEKFFLSWAKSIGEAARKGGIDQEELDWDSYDRIKEEINDQTLQIAKEKAKAKELAKITAAKAAQAKEAKMAMLAQKRKEREDRAKAREQAKKMAGRKAKRKTDTLPVVKDMTIKQRLTKIRGKKSINGQVVPGEALICHSPAWKKLNVEIMNREKVQRDISFADQIRAAKHKRTEPVAIKPLAESFTDIFSHGGH